MQNNPNSDKKKPNELYPLDVLILAGGSGTRMKSNQAKALHKIAGKSFLYHLIETSQKLSPNKIIIIQAKKNNKETTHTLKLDFNNSIFRDNLSYSPKDLAKIQWRTQAKPSGTADAVISGLKQINAENTLILYGDVPLISEFTLKKLILSYQQNQSGICLITRLIKNPKGYGRIIRNDKKEITGICEEKDADLEIKKNKEVNTGLMLVQSEILKKYLPMIKKNNIQEEYYLTDLIKIAQQNKIKINSIKAEFNFEVSGVNNKAQLENLERKYQSYLADELINKGVQLIDKNRIDIRGDLTCGKDVVIDVNSIFIGKVTLDDGVNIGANSIIKNSHIQENSNILPFSMIDGATIGKNNQIGPYARIRPETKTQKEVHIGNFVELKKTSINEASKVNHLSYLGDSEVGKNVNIGAGVITCNYDGVNKNRTQIDDDSFIGSGTQLVAPIHLKERSYVGAGSTLTKNTEKNSLSVTRAKLLTRLKLTETKTKNKK